MDKPEKTSRRKRSQNGGWRIIKGNLYARIQYTDEHGKKREKLRRAKNKTEVWQHVRAMKDELEKFGEDALRSDKMTFADLVEKYLEWKVFPAVISDGHKVAGLKSHSSVKRSVQTLKDFFGKKNLRKITPADIEKFKSSRLRTQTKSGNQRKIASVNRELQTLRAMLNFALRNDWILRNPFTQTENVISVSSEVERTRILSFDEEIRILSVCDFEQQTEYERDGKKIKTTVKLPSHLKPILICALDSAMRPDEIFKMQWRDIDFYSETICIRVENSKTEKERIVGMSDRLKVELEKLWQLSPKKLHVSVFGVSTIKKSFKTACLLASINDFRFRDCRHTAITRMVQSGKIPQAEIMKMTGHTQLKTFLRYVNLTPESAKQSAKVFGDFVELKSKEADFTLRFGILSVRLQTEKLFLFWLLNYLRKSDQQTS